MNYFNNVLLPSCALKVVFPILSMEGQKALEFYQINFIFVQKMDEGLTG